ncbi:hypothetical protein PYCC9005_000583 [Savitreella phatthalungensis]
MAEPLLDSRQSCDLDEDIPITQRHGDLGGCLSFGLLGVAILWPWNTFITASDFFSKAFDGRAFLHQYYSSIFTSCFTLVSFASVLYAARTVNESDPFRRISSTGLTIVITFILTSIITLAVNDATVFFASALAANVVAATAVGVLQVAAFSLAGRATCAAIPALMIGQGIAGIAPPILSLSLAVAGDDGTDRRANNIQAAMYFASASVMGLLALVAGRHLGREELVAPEERQATLSCEADIRSFLREPLPWAVFLVFAITLAVFPSVTAHVISVRPDTSAAVFVASGFLIWNVGDLCGRLALGSGHLRQRSARVLLSLAMARIILLPILYMNNVNGVGAVVGSDVLFFAWLAVFGISNGYVGSACMEAAVACSPPGQQQQRSALMSSMLSAGLIAGSLLSFIMP